MINIFESPVHPEFKTEMNEKLIFIKEKINKIVTFKDDIAAKGLETLEKVIKENIDIYLINNLCIVIILCDF